MNLSQEEMESIIQEETTKKERKALHAKLEPHNVDVQGIEMADSPDFADAYIQYAEHEDGVPFNEEELDRINDDSDFVYECVNNKIY